MPVPPSTPTPPALQPRDALWACACIALAFVAFAVWLPTHQYGDGRRYLSMFSAYGFGPEPHLHWAYIPTAVWFEHGLRALGWEATPGLALQLFSALGAAVGLGAAFVLARACGAGRRAAALAVLVFGLTPALALFGRVAEVHSFHFGAVALVFAGVVAGGRGSLVRAAALTALLGPGLFLTHHSGLLLYPGLALLAAWTARKGERLELRALVVCAIAAAGAAAVALPFAAHQYGVSVVDMFAASSNQVSSDAKPNHLRALTTNFLVPVALGWVLLAIGARGLWQTGRALFWCLFATCVPPMLFFAWWAVEERGAYLLGLFPLFIAGTAVGITPLLLRARRSRANATAPHPLTRIVGLGLLVQFAIGAFVVGEFEDGVRAGRSEARFDILERALAPVSGPKLIVTFEPDRQSPCARIWNLHEIKLAHSAKLAMQIGHTPDDVTRMLINGIEALTLFNSPANKHIYFDRTFWKALADDSAFIPYGEAFEAAVSAHFAIEVLEDGNVWKLAPRAPN